MDTLRRRDFDRSERCPKSPALLETLAVRKAYRGFAAASTAHLRWSSSKRTAFRPNKKDTLMGVFFIWWERVDSDHRSHRQQIYSLPPLAAREISHYGAGGRIRTPDLLITNQLLYQLSYTSTKQLYYNNIPQFICQHFFCFFFLIFQKNTL